MKKILTSILLFIFSVQINAQSNLNYFSTVSNEPLLQWQPKYEAVVRGNFFFPDSLYHKGELKTLKHTYTSELLYRFNQLEGTVQAKLEDGTEMLVDINTITYFKLYLKEKVVVFLPAKVPNGKEITLLESIYRSPTMQLLRDTRKVLKRKYDPIERIDFDETANEYTYYFNKGGLKSPFKEVNLTAKSLVKAMPEKKRVIEQFFKSAKNEDAIKLSQIQRLMKKLDTQKS
jgi:hypothetical protein